MNRRSFFKKLIGAAIGVAGLSFAKPAEESPPLSGDHEIFLLGKESVWKFSFLSGNLVMLGGMSDAEGE